MAVSVGSRPAIVEPLQVASTSLAGLSGSDAHSHRLQALPSSSASCHGALAVGAAFRVSSKGTPKRSRDLAAYATRAAGVIVLNLNTNTPLFSSTFASSQQPCTPPLVLYDASCRATFLVLRARSDDQEAELHVWNEVQASPSSSSDKIAHSTLRVPSNITSLQPLSGSELVAVHSDGSVSLYAFDGLEKTELALVTSLSDTKAQYRDLFVGVFDRNSATYMLNSEGARPPSALLVRIAHCTALSTSEAGLSGKRTGRKSVAELGAEANLTFIAIDDDPSRSAEQRIRKLGQAVLTAGDLGQDCSVHVHSSGRIAALSGDARLTTAILTSSRDGTPALAHVKSSQLYGLRRGPTANAKPSATAISRSTVMVAGLGTAADEPSQRLNLVLLDVEIDSALAEYSWKVAEDTGDVFLHRIGGNAALLLTAPVSTQQGKAMARVWNVPFSTGDGSHLRWSLIMRHLTQKWFSGEGGANDSLAEQPEHCRAILKKVREISSSSDSASAKMAASEEAFADWLKEQEAVAGAQGEALASSDLLPQSFVTTLLSLVVSKEEENDGDVYAKRIIHTLLKYCVLHAIDMPQSALLRILIRAGDWQALRMALQSVDDLRERDVVDALRLVLDARASDDADPTVPAVAEILGLITAVNLNSAELRRAMKAGLDAAHVETILLILQSWLVPDSKQPLLKATQADDDVSIKAITKPDLLRSLAFGIDFLDTFFPVMLSSPSMRAPLLDISSSIKSHLSTASSLGLLRGPLAAFAKVEQDREREAEALLIDSLALLDSDDDEDEDEDGFADENEARVVGRLWASGGRDALGGKAARPRTGASDSMQIGGGAHARSGQREKTRRQQAYEDRTAVGLYTLERFEP